MKNFKILKDKFISSLNSADNKRFFGISSRQHSINQSKLIDTRNNKKRSDSIDYLIISNLKFNDEVKPISKFWVIKYKNKIKLKFDLFILLLIASSLCYIIFWSSFMNKETGSIGRIFSLTVDIFLLISMALNFITEYKNKETGNIISSPKEISIHYIKTWFLFDLLTSVPFDYIYYTINKSENSLKNLSSNYNFWLVALKIVRMARLPKIFKLFSIKKFESYIEQEFSRKTNQNINLKIKLKYFYRVVRLLLISLSLVYLVSSIWFYICYVISYNGEDLNQNSYLAEYTLTNEQRSYYKLLMTLYHSLQTLTTIGYGDVISQNTNERILSCFIMLILVSFFTFTIGNLNDLLGNYNKNIAEIDQSIDIQRWIMFLGDFNSKKINNKIIKSDNIFNKNLILRLDLHFRYFPKHDRNNSVERKGPHFVALPKSLKFQIMKYLWNDILVMFNNFFLFNQENLELYKKFFYNISFLLRPRIFYKNDIIYKSHEYIHEMYLIEEGSIDVGYSFYENKNYIITNHISIKGKDYIGDYYAIFDRVPVYYYTVKSKIVKGYAIGKTELNRCLDLFPDYKLLVRRKSFRRYIDFIKIPMEIEISKELKIYNKNNNFKISLPKNNFDLVNAENQMKRLNIVIKKEKYTNKKIISEIEKEYAAVEDEFVSISRFLFNISLECDKEILKINSDLDCAIENLKIFTI